MRIYPNIRNPQLIHVFSQFYFMKFIKILPLFLVNLIFVFLLPSAQGQNSFIDSIVYNREPVMIEKLYIHTDREFYALGDTIWYKAYSLDGISNKPFISQHNLDVELISDKGLVIFNQRLLLNDGYAYGDFQIPDSIAPGSYVIRAFTPIIKCLGEQAFFYKMIRIENVMNSFEQQQLYAAKEKKEDTVDIAFLPEGGNLVYNVENNIAVKAVSKNGAGVNINGAVTDETGKLIVEFSTVYQGLGKFKFIPVPEHHYFVKVNGYPLFKYEFNDIKQEGLVLSVLHPDSGKNFIISIAQNPERIIKQRVFLTAMSRDEFVFYVEIELDKAINLIPVKESIIPPGITKITLVNQRFEPLAERLIFRNDPVIQLPVALNLNKTELSSREKVVLSLQIPQEEIDSAICHMSVSVINTGYIDSKGLSQNILSYLLLDSELKGVIESPSSFFIDDPTIKASEKLELLMLTQGWRKYLWDEYHDLKPDYRNIGIISGIEISGKVKRLLSKKPVRGGQVTVMFFDNVLSILELKTDSEGRFNSGTLFVSDSTHIFVQAKNEKDKKNTEILLDSVITENSIPVDFISKNLADLTIPLKFFRYNYYRRYAEREYNLKNGLMLEEVTIIGEKPKPEIQSRRYGVADESFKIEAKDNSYLDVLDYLQGRVPGVDVGSDYIKIRRSEGNAFILIDGIPQGSDGMAIETLKSIPMTEIDVVEVLKNISNLAVFGSQGAHGVVAIYTKRGEVVYREQYIPGIIVAGIKGFHKFRQFYSPVYNEGNLNREIPDYRPTLYWNPMITMDKKAETQLEFFTSDELSDYLVILEGITGDGRIIFNTVSFLVDKKNPDIK